MKELVCDRIEADIAVMVDENGVCHSLPCARFDRIPKEGDVYREDLTFDPEKTASRRARIAALFQKLKKKGE